MELELEVSAAFAELLSSTACYETLSGSDASAQFMHAEFQRSTDQFFTLGALRPRRLIKAGVA